MARLRSSDLPQPLLAKVDGGRRRSKYRAVRCEVDGEKFDSRLEMRRWLDLRTMERAGQIKHLSRQVDFPLFAGKQMVVIGKYVADFVYERDGATVIEDAKGVIPALGAWKLKHMAAQGTPVELWPPRKAKKRIAKRKPRQ